jgi:hypothetical protein
LRGFFHRMPQSPKRSRATSAELVSLKAMVTALRTHGLALLLVLNALVVGLAVGGIFCATP